VREQTPGLQRTTLVKNFEVRKWVAIALATTGAAVVVRKRFEKALVLAVTFRRRDVVRIRREAVPFLVRSAGHDYQGTIDRMLSHKRKRLVHRQTGCNLERRRQTMNTVS